ncbi:MAG: hypothetical protein H6713_36655 [Myxococcales bacterium]|nr:hypothetical protein [Myxococcales bacterium]
MHVTRRRRGDARTTPRARTLALLVLALALPQAPPAARAAAPRIINHDKIGAEKFRRGKSAALLGKPEIAAESFVGAGESWLAALRSLPETPETLGRRNTLINKALQAYLLAHEQRGAAVCPKLDMAYQAGRAYLKELVRVYAEDARELEEYKFVAAKIITIEDARDSDACRELAASEPAAPVAELPAAPPEPTPIADAPEATARARSFRVAGITAMSTGAALLVTGVAVGATYYRRGVDLTGRLDALYAADASPTMLDAVRQQGQAANTVTNLSFFLVGSLGGAAIITGALLYTRGASPRARGRSAARVRLRPAVGGLVLTGRW